jgi:Membrane bound beta barrel domain (DUF5777)
VRRARRVALAGLILGAALASPVLAQDEEVDPLQPDFTVVNLPTTLRLPRHAFAFRLTHRFTRPLGEGDFGDLVADFFGFDSGAQVGLELRFGLFTGTQLGVYRTNDRAIDFFLKHDFRPNDSRLGISLYGAVEGQDNFSEDFSPGVALVLSRKLGKRVAVYVEPAFVGNTARSDEPAEDDGTFYVGIGGRIRVASSVYLVGEFAPRVAGFKGIDPSDPSRRAANHVSFGIEKRVGGHSFQLNFSNYFGTTLRTIARGAATGDDFYIGFNLSRKFF